MPTPHPPSEPARFTWPPREPAASAPPREPRPPLDLPLPSPLARLWSDIERTWLGLASPPLADEMRQLPWAPDPAAAFCPRCGRSAGPFESDADGCPRCRRQRIPWQRLLRLGVYDDHLADWIRQLKFERRRAVGAALGELLGSRLAATLHVSPAIRRVVLVPVPMSFRRRMSRGIDHALVLARAVAAGVNRAPGPAPAARVLPLLRRQYRPSQLRVQTARRPANIAGAMLPRRFTLSPAAFAGPFGAWKGLAAPGTLLVIVDDVTTTGATLREASRVLRTGFRLAGVLTPPIWTAVAAVAESKTSNGVSTLPDTPLPVNLGRNPAVF